MKEGGREKRKGRKNILGYLLLYISGALSVVK
jgi:hypothetical protein